MKEMSYKGYRAQIMESDRLIGEYTHRLPPGSPLDVYYADQFKSVPENWIKTGAFVVPVKPNKGLWFNFRMNDENNTAVLMTIKGCNPITGLPTSGFHLDRYVDRCPKHNCHFEAERFCPECGYQWPERSYLSGSPLWWDGWTCDGAVRQFFFTEDMMRDVATHMIGKENTVPAFGFAFYSPKEKRSSISSYIIPQVYLEADFGDSDVKYLSQPHNSYLSSSTESKGLGTLGSFSTGSKYKSSGIRKRSLSKSSSETLYAHSVGADMGVVMDQCDYGYNPTINECCTDGLQETIKLRSAEPFVPQKEVSIGAGAKIRQELPVDSYGLDTWNDKPDSVMTIYFVFQEEFLKMAEGGFKDYKDCKDGMLSGIPVG